jgi:hypothetical protein
MFVNIVQQGMKNPVKKIKNVPGVPKANLQTLKMVLTAKLVHSVMFKTW